MPETSLPAGIEGVRKARQMAPHTPTWEVDDAEYTSSVIQMTNGDNSLMCLPDSSPDCIHVQAVRAKFPKAGA